MGITTWTYASLFSWSNKQNGALIGVTLGYLPHSQEGYEVQMHKL